LSLSERLYAVVDGREELRSFKKKNLPLFSTDQTGWCHGRELLELPEEKRRRRRGLRGGKVDTKTRSVAAGRNAKQATVGVSSAILLADHGSGVVLALPHLTFPDSNSRESKDHFLPSQNSDFFVFG
jgi:hypothetical protein